MSKIFELYGHRLDNWDKKAAANCSLAWCPFMDAECDGGGNRYSSALDVRSLPALRKHRMEALKIMKRYRLTFTQETLHEK